MTYSVDQKSHASMFILPKKCLKVKETGRCDLYTHMISVHINDVFKQFHI